MEVKNINMPITPGQGLFDSIYIVYFLRITIFIILFLYIIFSLLIVRQVSIMSRTLITPVSPVVKAFAIIHAGFAIAFFVLVIGVI